MPAIKNKAAKELEIIRREMRDIVANDVMTENAICTIANAVHVLAWHIELIQTRHIQQLEKDFNE